jgi:hypothetical protein
VCQTSSETPPFVSFETPPLRLFRVCWGSARGNPARRLRMGDVDGAYIRVSLGGTSSRLSIWTRSKSPAGCSTSNSGCRSASTRFLSAAPFISHFPDNPTVRVSTHQVDLEPYHVREKARPTGINQPPPTPTSLGFAQPAGKNRFLNRRCCWDKSVGNPPYPLTKAKAPKESRNRKSINQSPDRT